MLFIRNLPTWAEYLAFSPDRSCLASAGGDSSSIHIWDPNTGKPLLVLQRPVQSHVEGFVFSLGGSMLAAAYTRLSEVVLWAFGQANPFVIPNTHPGLCGACIAFSPDRETLAAAFAYPTLPDGRPTFGVWFWNVTGPRRLPPQLLMPRDQRVTSIAFSPTGAQLLTVCRPDAGLASAGRFEFTLCRFDVARRAPVGPPAPIGMAVAFGEREASEFQPAVFSPDRTRIAMLRVRQGRRTTGVVRAAVRPHDRLCCGDQPRGKGFADQRGGLFLTAAARHRRARRHGYILEGVRRSSASILRLGNRPGAFGRLCPGRVACGVRRK